MSDNIIRPTEWLNNARESINVQNEDPTGDLAIGGGGDGPHNPDMEIRIAALEEQGKDTRNALIGVDKTLVRIETTLASLATKADIAGCTGSIVALTSRLEGFDKRLSLVEGRIESIVGQAIAKTIGGWQLIGILASLVALGTIVVGAARFLLPQFFGR